MFEYVEQVKDLTDSERLLFGNELRDKSKTIWIGQLSCLFFGFLGAHRFYLNDNKKGLFYFVGIPTLFFISIWLEFIPLLALLVIVYILGLLTETLVMRDRVNTYNLKIATDTSQKIKDLRVK